MTQLQLEQIETGTMPHGEGGDTYRSGTDKTNRNMAKIQDVVNGKLDAAGGKLSGAAQWWYEAKDLPGGYALGYHYLSSGDEKLSFGALGNSDTPGSWQTVFMGTGPNGYDQNSSPSGVWADVGGTLRTKGAWTHLGNALLRNANGAGVSVTLSANAGKQSYMMFSAGGVYRFAVGLDGSAEGGNNTGSNLNIYRYSDAGVYIDSPLGIGRGNGKLVVPNGISFGGSNSQTYSVGAYANTFQPTSSGGYNYPLVFFNAAGSIVGTITSNDSSTGFNSASDYRLKQKYAPIGGALESINRMVFYTGEFIAEPGRLVDYCIAHEVQNEMPFAVTGGKDAVQLYPVLRDGADPGNVQPDDVIEIAEAIIPQTVDYSKLVPRMGASIQELSAMLAAAVARIEQLEARK